MSTEPNSDGGVDKSELSAFLQNTSATNSTSTNDSSDIDDLFSEMDADGDGSITQQETSDAVNNMLKQLQNQMMNSRTGGAGGPPPLTSVGFFMSCLRALVMVGYQGGWGRRAKALGNRGREVMVHD